MDRPRNWYAMSYEERREWERAAEVHRREIADLEDRASWQLQEERDDHRRRLRAGSENYQALANDHELACDALARAERFIDIKGLRQEYERFETEA